MLNQRIGRYAPAASGLPAVIGGLLGLEFLSKFEVEFDFVNKAMKFHSPGCIKCGALARAHSLFTNDAYSFAARPLNDP